MENKIELFTKTLGEIFEPKDSPKDEGNILVGKLTIPDYQRIYCWQDKHVYKLLDDIIIFAKDKRKYHLGSIILHRKNEEKTLEIVDGQQRLVTLAILLKVLKKDTPLLESRFESEEAIQYIGYNKYIIEQYCTNKQLDTKTILENLLFSVLVLDGGNLDLAYTFFSNQNSRGKELTDFELLKAHHLRFVTNEFQAIHLAERWDNLLLDTTDESSDKNLNRTFGIYLFRLRKWMRKRLWNDDEKFKVKTEFEAALTIDAIPPFGEQFKYYEMIQGGSHFFAYSEQFVFYSKIFSQQNEYKLLRQHLSNETHCWYRDIIEAFLFAYFLKFGTIYLSDAMKCILKIVSHHRYGLSRTSLKKLLEYAGNTEIVMMIDQATSPTFFLAETLDCIRKLPSPDIEITGIRKRYHDSVKRIISELDLSLVIDNIKNIKFDPNL